ncbi:MAG: hypothetical protein IJ849_12970 [Selenomonadaceae bacterium]|nr:hypothetical protein [Selenomonadaceae bacterium]
MKIWQQILVAVLAVCCFVGINPAEAAPSSPEWVASLEAAKDAKQMVVVAGVSGAAASISMHNRAEDGSWEQIMSTPGFIGVNGLGKDKEWNGKTPVGVFHFNRAFGLADDPGCALDYVKVDENYYWSGDARPGMKYNQLVDIRELPALNVDVSEHLVYFAGRYDYCLNISYNEEGVPGVGSAIFLQCFDKAMPFTGGGVAIPADKMRFVMENVQPDCVVVIDSLNNLGGKF